MDGFTDFAFRHIAKEIFAKYGEQDKYDFVLWTEFMNADGYLINPPGVIRHLLTDSSQTPGILQIFGGNSATLISAFGELEQKYGQVFTGIELNLGCPARNVVNT